MRRGGCGVRRPRTKAAGIGELVREVRLARQLTTTAFGAHCDVDHGMVTRWEQGKSTPDFVQLAKVGEVAPRPLRDRVVEELRKMLRREPLLAVMSEVAGGAV